MAHVDLRCGASLARISMDGAEWLSWTIDTRNLLWTPDPVFWDSTAPILFPVCGWTRNGEARVGETAYPLSLHGFARHGSFRIAEAAADRVVLVLVDDARTRALYPFAFLLRVEYRLTANAMTIRAEILNRDDRRLPYAFGLHPGFARDPDAPASVTFDEPERADVPVIAPGGLFSPERRPIEIDGRRLALMPETFAREALCFVPARSRGLMFECGALRLRADYPDFDNLVLWSRPGAPFLCIEPWTGFGDPVDFSDDLFAKPGMTILQPGQSATHTAVFTVLP